MIAHTGSPQLYLAFSLLVVVFLIPDFVLLRAKGQHKVPVSEALIWSIVWFLSAMAFAGWLWWHLDDAFGREVANARATEYVSGYLIEKALAMENVFVWVTIFTYVAVPAEFQKRVFLWGVIGAIIMRSVLIYLGVLLIEKFDWIFYVFGAFLLFTGIKMCYFGNQKPDLGANPLLKWLRAHVTMTQEYEGEKFVVRRNGLWVATPLVLVEFTDLIFAIDSIPAIFAFTIDPFIVFTSNIFAILGLRAMYFLLADMADRFHLLLYGLALIVSLVGVKMLIADFYKVPIMLMLAVVFSILVGSVVASLYTSRPEAGGRGWEGA